MSGYGDSQRKENPRISNPEKVSFVLSLIILAALVGAVLYIWISPTQKPARFSLERGAVRLEGDKYYLDITVKNTGDETAKEVWVDGRLSVGGKEEKASTIFGFIPGRSEEKGVLIFSADPTDAVIRVESYQKAT